MGDGNDWTSLVGMAGMLVAGAGVFYTLKGSVEASIILMKEQIHKNERDIEDLKKADTEHTRQANENQKEILSKISDMSITLAIISEHFKNKQ